MTNKIDISSDMVRIITHDYKRIIIRKDVCNLCGFYKALFEFDTSGDEYASDYFCIDCLNNIWEEYYKIFQDDTNDPNRKTV